MELKQVLEARRNLPSLRGILMMGRKPVQVQDEDKEKDDDKDENEDSTA
jgi:hypothetical protein